MSTWTTSSPLRWSVVGALLRDQPAGSIAVLPPWRVEHPRDGGLAPAIGMPDGQRASYRLDVGKGHDLVVSEYADRFEAWLERRPGLADVEGALRDTPGTSVAGLIAVGALVGLALGRSKESAFAGAAIGGIAALAGVGVATAKSSPEVSEAASRMLAALPTPAPSSTLRSRVAASRRPPK